MELTAKMKRAAKKGYIGPKLILMGDGPFLVWGRVVKGKRLL